MVSFLNASSSGWPGVNTALQPQAGSLRMRLSSTAELPLCSAWAVTISFFIAFVFLYFYLQIIAGLKSQRLLMQTWSVWLSLTCSCGLSMLCGHVARNQPEWEGESCCLTCLHIKLLSNSLWEGTLWNFSAFCLCYQTSGFPTRIAFPLLCK